MTKALFISNKVLSVRGSMSITDELDRPVYDAHGEIALNPTWRIMKGPNQVATIKKKIFSLVPTWIVSSIIGDFIIRRKLWSWVHSYIIVNGPYDGAVIKGSSWNRKFEISHHAQTIALAKGKLISLRDRHEIQLIDDSESAELLTVLVMVALHLERKSDGASSASSSG